MEYQVITRGSIVRFVSLFTNLEALQILATLTANNFAADLVNKANGNGLSDKQWAWVHKLAVDASTPKPEPVTVDVSGIYALFQNYKGKNPRIDIFVNDVKLRIAKAGEKSQYCGSLMISKNGYGTPFYGVISQNGEFSLRHEANEAVIEAIKAFSSDPAALAAQHGHMTGNCCFCRRKLTDERSTTVGYGPECAENYGLPWG